LFDWGNLVVYREIQLHFSDITYIQTDNPASRLAWFHAYSLSIVVYHSEGLI